MGKKSSNAELRRAIKLTVYTVVTHSLLPLMLFPVSLYVMPRFMEQFTMTGMEASACLKIVSAVTSFVGRYPYFFTFILGAGITVDAAICFVFFRSKRKIGGDIWSGLVILVQAVFAGVCALAFASVFGD